MSAAHKAALATIRRVAEQLRKGFAPEERHVPAKLLREALELLEQGADRRRMSSLALAGRVRRLEGQLRDLPAAERARIIRERLGISKSAFYRLRSMCQSQ